MSVGNFDPPPGTPDPPDENSPPDFTQNLTNCGECRNFWRIDLGYGRGPHKCPDPRCFDQHVIPAGYRPPPPQKQVVQQNQGQQVAPRRRGAGRPRGTGPLHTPAGIIPYSPVPLPLWAPTFNNFGQRLPLNPVGQVMTDPHTQQPVTWTGKFVHIMAPDEIERCKYKSDGKPNVYPRIATKDWNSEGSYAMAAPRGCIDGEPEKQADVHTRWRKWDDFVRAAFYFGKSWVVEQMGADPKSFPYVREFHGARDRTYAPWQAQWRKDMAKLGAWQGPWPNQVVECEEARAQPITNMLRVYCNKCKELGLSGCSWSMKTCQSCAQNGWKCVRERDFMPKQPPKIQPDRIKSHRDQLQKARYAEDEDRRKAEYARRRKQQNPRTAPYERPGLGRPRNVLMITGRGPARTNEVVTQTPEDAENSRRAASELAPMIEWLRITYCLWTQEAEDIVTSMFNIGNAQGGFNLPQTLEQLNHDSDAWFDQFPDEIRNQFNTVKGLLVTANTGYEGAQHLVDRRGYNTFRQRAFLSAKEQWADQEARNNQIPVADRWKCYRCYHLMLPCELQGHPCSFCKDANHQCQRSEEYTTQLRHDLEHDALLCQTLTEFLNADAPTYPDEGSEFVPCLQCTRTNSEEFCTWETPCPMCVMRNEGFLCRAENPNAVRREEPTVAPDFPQVVENDQTLLNMDMNMFQDIYNASPLLPAAERREPTSLGQGDTTQFTDAGPPDWELLNPTDGPDPDPLKVSFDDAFDPGGILKLHELYDPNADHEPGELIYPPLDVPPIVLFDENRDAILNDPVFSGVREGMNGQQVEPRFPLSSEPWDGAAFAKDAMEEGQRKIRIRLLEEINPREPEPPIKHGCDEAPFPAPPGEDASMDLVCGNEPAALCKYIGGSWQDGDHPRDMYNPASYMVCKPHSEASRQEYEDRAKELFKQVKGWYCPICVLGFGPYRKEVLQLQNAERDDENLICSCNNKFNRTRLCLTHTKKSYETILARVKRFNIATMEKYSYKACGKCFYREGLGNLGVWKCLSCNDVCWEMSGKYRLQRITGA